MKKGKEVKLPLSERYNIRTGTVDNQNPKSIYINISTWGEPKKEDVINYDRVISGINKSVKANITKSLNSMRFHKDKVIVDLDMRKSGVEFGRRSYMNCEITLFQINKYKINSEELLGEIELITKNITNMFDNNEYFKFHRAKK